jgi:hypothetical protein
MQPHFGQEQVFINNGQHPLFLVDDAAETGNGFLEDSMLSAVFKNDGDEDDDQVDGDEEEPHDLADGSYDD